MNPILQRTLKAYRPLYLHGLLKEGQYRLPALHSRDDPAASATRPGRCLLRVALTSLGRHLFNHRSQP